jgi:uncharacterized membrane protein (UPF0127 family)
LTSLACGSLRAAPLARLQGGLTMRTYVLASIVACGSPSGMPTGTISIAGHELSVEVAANGGDRARGLMHRDRLKPDAGMVFVYPDAAPRSFWMKDTRIPLSIAYVNADGVIVRIADMRPLDTSTTSSLYPAQWAIEVNQGWFARNGIEAGAKVDGLKDLPTGAR